MAFCGDTSFEEQLSLIREDFTDIKITSFPLSVRITNRLNSNRIFTVADLLGTKPNDLMQFKGFGRTCLEEVENFLMTLSDDEYSSKRHQLQENYQPQEGNSKNGSSLILDHAEAIALGDFTFCEDMILSDEEKHVLSEYKEGYEILGGELVLECCCNPAKVSPIVSMFGSLYADYLKRLRIREIAEEIPAYRFGNRAIGYIYAFTSADNKRKQLLSLCQYDGCTIRGLINGDMPSDVEQLYLLQKFVKWCSFDLAEDIRGLFEKIYYNDRSKVVVQLRARGKTLEYIGSQLGVTRERVRQIEGKAKLAFSRVYSRERIISKIAAERNGAKILTPADIEKYCASDTVELLYFLRSYRNTFFTYDEQLDVFIISDDSIHERVRSCMEYLPDIIKSEQLTSVLEEVCKNNDIPVDLLQKVVLDEYRLTAGVYHRERLSLGKIYLAVLKKHYPDGIKAYDFDELQAFRAYVYDEYGDVGLPDNDRALSARIAAVCVLCGRGMYKPKQDKYISEDLANRILQYIENSDQTVFMMNTLYSVFEAELNDEGVYNKYYLQGILRALYPYRYYFRKDYLSKDAEFPSFYASIVNFIRESKYPVQKQQIKNKFPGVSDMVIQMSVSDREIINLFGSYLHADRLILSATEKYRLHEILQMMLSDNEAHHASDVYSIVQAKMPEAFARNGAMNAFSAFSILEYLFGEDYQFLRPYIAVKGVEVGRPGERLHNLIYSADEVAISDIKEFCKENHFQIQSLLEYINSCNDRFFLRDKYTMVTIDSLGIAEPEADFAEREIAQEVNETMPISCLTCWNRLPRINIQWTEWLLYSVLKKWGKRLTVAVSAAQLRQAVPLVAPRGEMDTSKFSGIAPEQGNKSAKIDDLDMIDDLIADLIEVE